MRIGVYGSAAGNIGQEVEEKAKEIGREIARRGHVLITGACPGLPYAATLGAREIGGRTIGYSPGLDFRDHVDRFKFPAEGFDELVFLPADYPYRNSKGSCLKCRNVSSVTDSDAVVIMSGRCGTLNEFTIAYDLGKDIGVLSRTGGITNFIQSLVTDFNKPSSSRLVYEESSKIIIAKLEDLAKEKR